MPAMRQCRGCGTDVPANAPFGHCPKCLLELGFGPVPEDLSALSAAAPKEGRTFGEYELLEPIGRGGMGVIYKARQRSLNRLVALKMVNTGEFASPEMVQRFHLEAEAAANLHHPNIVPIYETGEHQGQHFFSMELIDGTGLDRHFTGEGFCFGENGERKTSPRPRQEQIARIMAKVARAVDYAHQHGVLHRDIKPGNIILDRHEEPHLTDFGVAKVIGHTGSGLTASGVVIGTPSYMAPEQAAGHAKRLTTAADIYSLGAVLYAMLTGHPPFRADTPVQTLKQVVEQEPKPPTTFSMGIDHDLANICMKCLEKEPQRRYSTAAALAEDLERWLRKEPIEARPVRTPERLWRWCRRNPKVAALGASVAVLLLAISVGSTVALLRIKGLNATLQSNDRELAREVLNNLTKVFSDPNTTNYLITAEARWALTSGKRTRRTSGVPLRLIHVEYVYSHPTKVLEILSPIIGTIEENLSKNLKRPVLIDLKIFRSYDLAFDALESDAMAFGRIGPASYVQLLDRGKGVRLLAMQDHKKPLTLALFTRTNSALGRVLEERPQITLGELLANCSLALGDRNSTTGNYFPRQFLATNGIYATSLSRYTNANSVSHVIDLIREGHYDVGAGNRDVVDDEPDLKVISAFEVPDLGRCWVAGKGLDSILFTNLQQFLLPLQDKAILGRLESEVSGFKMLTNPALQQLREIMRGAAAFDTREK